MVMQIVTIPCLDDNFAYLVHDSTTGATAVIDVPDETPIESELANRGWLLSDILITHHHNDHIDGVEALREVTGARVIGAKADAHRLPRLDLAVAEGDAVPIGSAAAEVIDVPGHTVGHVAFYLPAGKTVFTADSLMGMGCGRLFEGTPDQMWDSLSKLARLPADTWVCSGHNYLLANAKFALTIEPDNPDLMSRVKRVRRTQAEGQPDDPATMAEELATNPFLRAGNPDVKRALGMEHASDAEVFAEIRRRKDNF